MPRKLKTLPPVFKGERVAFTRSVSSTKNCTNRWFSANQTLPCLSIDAQAEALPPPVARHYLSEGRLADRKPSMYAKLKDLPPADAILASAATTVAETSKVSKAVAAARVPNPPPKTSAKPSHRGYKVSATLPGGSASVWWWRTEGPPPTSDVIPPSMFAGNEELSGSIREGQDTIVSPTDGGDGYRQGTVTPSRDRSGRSALSTPRRAHFADEGTPVAVPARVKQGTVPRFA